MLVDYAALFSARGLQPISPGEFASDKFDLVVRYRQVGFAGARTLLIKYYDVLDSKGIMIWDAKINAWRKQYKGKDKTVFLWLAADEVSADALLLMRSPACPFTVGGIYMDWARWWGMLLIDHENHLIYGHSILLQCYELLLDQTKKVRPA